jgi:hypothetical protein
MSQQAAAGQGAGCGGGRKPRYFPRGGGIDVLAKGYKSAIMEIAQHTFNTGKNKFVAQFTESRKKVANYLQRNVVAEGYLVAETVRTRKQQTIELPPAVDPNAADKANLEIIWAKDVKLVAKRHWNLEESLKKGYATVYDQCSQVVVQAKEARRAQAMLGNPSKKDYKGMVSNNLIANCPITSSDITNARTIFGPDLASIRGKTVRRTPAPVVADFVAVPRGLVDANKVITLAADVFFVNRTAFHLTISRRI